MKRSAFFFAGAIVAFMLLGNMFVQAQVRTDDHFTRTLAVVRIDLDEKINKPIIEAADPSLYSNASNTTGMIDALMRGLKEGRYLAYNPDTLQKAMTWDDVKMICEDMYGVDESEIFGGQESYIDEACDWCGEDEEEWVGTGNNPEPDSDPFVSAESFLESMGGYTADGNFGDAVIAPMSTVVELIENRIFDKNRSDMVYDIEYIRIVWVDPGETLPDRIVACLKYDDVLETLANCQWTNRFNEAEHRNLREILDLRLFHGYDSELGSRGFRTLAETEHNRNQQLNFEHHLWSY